MKVWKINCKADKYNNLTTSNDFDLTEFLHSFDGKPKKLSWKSPELKFATEGTDVEVGDFTPFTNGILVVSKEIAENFQKSFGNAIEVLEITSVKGFYIIHVLDVCECVDYEKSEVDYYPDMKRIMFIDEYAFKKDIVASKTIFKDSGFPKSHIFVTDECKREIESWHATGVEFIEYWDSEA